MQQLDAGIAAHLGHHSQSVQRRETFRLLQEQNALMPVLAERLQSLAETLERQQQAAGERLQADQQAFHQRTDAAYTQLAASLRQALHDGVENGWPGVLAHYAALVSQPVAAGDAA